MQFLGEHEVSVGNRVHAASIGGGSQAIIARSGSYIAVIGNARRAAIVTVIVKSLRRRRRPDKASRRSVSIRRVPPFTLIQLKEDKMEELEEHHSLNASVHLKARVFKILMDFKIYLRIFYC
jgi:hypothetical protein